MVIEHIHLRNVACRGIYKVHNCYFNKGNLQVIDMKDLKAALYTIVPRSPFFALCTPKYCRLQKCG